MTLPRRYIPQPRALLLLPTVAWVLLFFVVPLVLVFVDSFAQINLVTLNLTYHPTLGNYAQINDPLYYDTLIRSVVLSLSTTAACLFLGFPLAYFISRQPARTQRILLIGVIIPFWTSFIVRIYAIVNVLGYGGPLQDLLGKLGVNPHALNIIYSPTAIGIGIVYCYLPLMVLPVYVALDRIDNTLLAAASDLGSNPIRTFWRVTLPLARPGLVVGCIIVGIPALGEYVIPSILGGDKTLMLGNVISDQFLAVGNVPFGAALTVMLMAIMGIALVALRRYRPVHA